MAEQTANPVAHAIEQLGGADVVREIANGIASDGNYLIGVHARELLRDLLVGVVPAKPLEPEAKKTTAEEEATPSNLRRCAHALSYNVGNAECAAKWMLFQAARVIEKWKTKAATLASDVDRLNRKRSATLEMNTKLLAEVADLKRKLEEANGSLGSLRNFLADEEVGSNHPAKLPVGRVIGHVKSLRERAEKAEAEAKDVRVDLADETDRHELTRKKFGQWRMDNESNDGKQLLRELRERIGGTLPTVEVTKVIDCMLQDAGAKLVTVGDCLSEDSRKAIRRVFGDTPVSGSALRGLLRNYSTKRAEDVPISVVVSAVAQLSRCELERQEAKCP